MWKNINKRVGAQDSDKRKCSCPEILELPYLTHTWALNFLVNYQLLIFKEQKTHKFISQYKEFLLGLQQNFHTKLLVGL